MRIDRPDPRPRESGDYRVDVTKGYGDPTADIWLDETGELRLQWVHVDDCDRLIRAAADAKERIIRYRAQMEAPHGRAHFYKGTCQLCGKPEDDGLHADPPAPVITGSEAAAPGCGARHAIGAACELHREGFHVAPGENEGDLDMEWAIEDDEPEPGTQAYADKYSSRTVQRELLDHPDCAGPAFGEAELRRADAYRDHPEQPAPEDRSIGCQHDGQWCCDGCWPARRPAFVTEISGVPVSAAFGLVAS